MHSFAPQCATTTKATSRICARYGGASGCRFPWKHRLLADLEGEAQNTCNLAEQINVISRPAERRRRRPACIHGGHSSSSTFRCVPRSRSTAGPVKGIPFGHVASPATPRQTRPSSNIGGRAVPLAFFRVSVSATEHKRDQLFTMTAAPQIELYLIVALCGGPAS